MEARGWTIDSIRKAIDQPYGMSPTISRGNGNGPATAYFVNNGQYVVVDDMTDQVIAISDLHRQGWIIDRDIQLPIKIVNPEDLLDSQDIIVNEDFTCLTFASMD
jgi:hypothetical protein